QAGDEEGGLPRPGDEGRVVDARVLEEDLRVGPVADPGAGHAALRLADDLELAALVVGGEVVVRRALPLRPGDVGEGARLTPAEAHGVGLARPVNLDVEARGEGVDDRGADAVQAAGGRVRAAAELPARVELGVDDLDAGQAGPRLDVDRDPATVVAHLHRAVGVEDDVDPVTVTTERLVDRVVDDLPHAVHE